MPNKLTDEEIVKALKTLLELVLVEGCLQRAKTISLALDLINRQQAENKRLYGDIMTYKLRWARATVKLDTAKSEAYKEFAEKLKHKAINIGVNDSIVSTFAIDETLRKQL